MPSDFPQRGQPDSDRDYRHPRVRAERPSKRGASKILRDEVRIGADTHVPPDEWDLLPPVSEIIDAIDTFVHHYFQLSFISKHLFVSRLNHDRRSVSPFLLLSILSISASLTPSLARRFGSGAKASDIFMDHATKVSKKKVYDPPTLEACQAFYLLGMAQQQREWKNLSGVSNELSHTVTHETVSALTCNR